MSFEAKFAGECGEGDRIVPGQSVEYRGDVLCHVECPLVATSDPAWWGASGQARPDDGLEPPRGVPLCGTCWCYHRGECS